MKKSSIIFKMICLAIATVLCLSAIPAMAEETAVVEETIENVTDEIEETTEEVVQDETEETVEDTEEPVEETTEEVAQDETEEVEEVLDLFAATLRDGGVYVTPGEFNAAVFTYDNLRYKVAEGTGNAIRLDGFESDVNIEDEEISETAKNMLRADGTITTDAAHSGYFGLSVEGDMIYRTAVTGEAIYVFSAWVKMPKSGIIDDDDRAFIVTGESGNTYVVGWNEIGREIEATGVWQQIIFTFKAPETGLFAIDFAYRGKEALAIDDIELYEAEIFDNPLTIKDTVCIDAEGNEYSYSTGFSTSGTLTHKTTLYNSDEDDVYFAAVMVLYKNDIMIAFEAKQECALVLDETEVEFEIEIPEDEDLSQYKYMVYFINDTNPTQFYGYVPSRTNPYVVKGN